MSFNQSNDKYMVPLSRPIDVLIDSPSFADVRVYQPFSLLQRLGWDVRLHFAPVDLEGSVRPRSLVVSQRPLASAKDTWESSIRFLRTQRCLVIVEYDDHPDLFPKSFQERFAVSDYWHLRCCHALQTSSSALASALKDFHENVFVVENAVDQLPSINVEKHDCHSSRRVFLGNFNRHIENVFISRALREWIESDDSLTLVVVSQAGVDNDLFGEKVEWHEPLPYAEYRKLLSTCHVALLPLCFGLPQSCKTPIKWMEAAAESTAVVAGPELYGPWLGDGRYGLAVQSLDEIVLLARRLMNQPAKRKAMVKRAYERARELELHRQLPWRMELYHHLDRLSDKLETSMRQKFLI